MADSKLTPIWQKQRRGEPLTPDERRLRSEYNTKRAHHSTRIYWADEEEKEWVQQQRKAAGYGQDSAFIRDLVTAQIKRGIIDPDALERLEEDNRQLREDLERWKEMHNEVASENRELTSLNRELQHQMTDLLRDVLAQAAPGGGRTG